MSKICTDLEQSRKLVKMKLDKNTADMHYFSDGYNPTKLDVGYSAENAKFYRGTKNEYTPAWSLSALLKLIPNFNMFKRTIECRIETTSHLVDKACDPIDAAFEMVVWLLENKHIK